MTCHTGGLGGCSLQFDLRFLNTSNKEFNSIDLNNLVGKFLIVLSNEGECPCSSSLDSRIEIFEAYNEILQSSGINN